MTVTLLKSITKELDASGLNCPLPILKTRKALGGIETGDVLRVLSTDPGSGNDMESFCKQTGHDLLSSSEDEGTYVFLIRKN